MQSFEEACYITNSGHKDTWLVLFFNANTQENVDRYILLGF